MQTATDKIQIFTPDEIIRKIGGDEHDVFKLLQMCAGKGDYAAIDWALHGDHSKPWPFSVGAERGDTLIDIRIEKHCADMHAVATQAHLDDEVKSSRLQLLKKYLLTAQAFEERKFHRDEIARWLVDFGLQSAYRFSREAEPVQAPNGTHSPATPVHAMETERLAKIARLEARADYEARKQTAPQSEATPAPVAAASDVKQWLLIDPRDPPIVQPKDQPWYTPARYFARQLVIDDSTLLTKKPLLADKVSQSLGGVGIFMRGGKKPPAADTILKAFANVMLG